MPRGAYRRRRTTRRGPVAPPVAVRRRSHRCPGAHHDVLEAYDAFNAGARYQGGSAVARRVAAWVNSLWARGVAHINRGRCLEGELDLAALEGIMPHLRARYGIRLNAIGRRLQTTVRGRARGPRSVPGAPRAAAGFGNVPLIQPWPVRTIRPQQFGPDFTQQPDPVGFPNASNVDGIGNYVMDREPE